MTARSVGEIHGAEMSDRPRAPRQDRGSSRLGGRWSPGDLLLLALLVLDLPGTSLQVSGSMQSPDMGMN